MADENIASVREQFVSATSEAVQDGELSDAILEYNPSYEYGRSAEALTAAPAQAVSNTDSEGDGSGGLDTTAIIIHIPQLSSKTTAIDGRFNVAHPIIIFESQNSCGSVI